MTYEQAAKEYRQARFALDWAQGVFFTAEDAGLPRAELESIERQYRAFDRQYDMASDELNWFGTNESYWSDERDAA